MDPASRNIILENEDYLSKRIDLKKLRPILEKYQIFTYAMLNDIYDFPSEYNFYVELVTRGPDAFEKFIKVLKEVQYFDEANILLTKSPTSLKKTLCYKMNSKPYIGHCCIINNVEFKEHTYRHGSDVDARALSDLFGKLGFNVECKRNLEREEMADYLINFSKKDWSAVDSCVLFILSHGDNVNNVDIIYGSDSKDMTKNYIYQLFNNENCIDLKFKPKMFFFQACRGDEKDLGLNVTVSTDVSKLVKIPSMSDMFVVHSSLPNHVSYRDHEEGTWFCQDLIQVFSSDYLTQDLGTMLQSVAQRLESRLSEKQCKQVLHTDNFGIKAKIFFSMESVAEICEIFYPNKSLKSLNFSST